MPDLWNNTSNLSGALNHLEADHRHLESIALQISTQCPTTTELSNCHACAQRDSRKCDSHTENLLRVLLEFCWVHAAHEVRLMKAYFSPDEYFHFFLSHLEEHADMSQDLMQISTLHDVRTPGATLHDLQELLQRWTGPHEFTYDTVLIELVKGKIGMRNFLSLP